MKNTIMHKWSYNHSPAEIWEYLTRADLLELWLMKNDIQPVVGHKFQFRHNPMPNVGLNGIVDCEVLEVVPFKKLSYSWKAGAGDGTLTLDSVVVWTLHPKGAGTELELVHSGFKDEHAQGIYLAMSNGWMSNMKKIDGLINTAKHDTAKP